MNLEHVNISALAKVASQVYKLGLDNTSITPEQAVEVMSALEGNERVMEVDMCDTSLSAVEPRLMAKAFARSKRVKIANTGLTAEQISQILEVQTEEKNLEELDLSANQLQMINGEMMANSFNTMKSVTLLDSGITMNQVGQVENN